MALWGNRALLGIALDSAFAACLDAVRLCREVGAGRVQWTEILPDVRCADPRTEALTITRD